jgi:hypothetical protein
MIMGRMLLVCVLAGQAVNAPIVNFHPDGFWLNLHHFLYVLGQAEARMPNWQRAAVSNASIDQNKVLPGLTPQEQRWWREAIAVYVAGPSRLDTVFDRQLVRLTGTLAALGDAATLGGSQPPIPADIAATLERVAPIYRKGWWSAHQDANREWVREMRALVDRHGDQILGFLSCISSPGHPVGIPFT